MTKTFGDANFTNTANTPDLGTGTVTYSSDDPSVATVNSGTGEVTIVGAGAVHITASISADATHYSVTESYVLTINNASQAAPLGVSKTDETSAGTTTIADGKTTVTVNQDVLNDEIKNANDNVTVVISANEISDTVEALFVVKNVDDMTEKELTLTIQTGNVQYNIPPAAIDTAALMQALGAGDPADVPRNVGTGLISGRSGGMLAPLDSITRVETATIVLSLLRMAGLVDDRTPTQG
jgi:hypothetical protein